MRNIEMHCHSNLSDGKNTPDEVITEAKACHLSFLALTDHDAISPEDFQRNLQQAWISTCDSVEISAQNSQLGKSLHLTSYAQKFSPSLHDLLWDSRDGKMNMKWWQFRKLVNELWFIGSAEGFDAYIREKLWREPVTSNTYDMSRYFMSLKENRDKARSLLWERAPTRNIVQHFYLECLKREWSLYRKYGFEVPKYEPDIEQVVHEVSKKSWGIVSMAHPNVTFMKKKWEIPEFERTIQDYVKKWVRGVEVNAIAPLEWVKAIMKEKQKHDLILTFGSDCHEIGKTDSKHSTIGRINPFIDQLQLEENFSKFQQVLSHDL